MGRDLVHSCPASKGTRLKMCFAPTEYSWSDIRKLHSKGISGLQGGMSSKPKAAQSEECRTVSAAKAVGWELDRQVSPT